MSKSSATIAAGFPNKDQAHGVEILRKLNLSKCVFLKFLINY